MIEQAKTLAARPEVRRESDPAHRVAALYRIILGRGPDDDEVHAGRPIQTALASVRKGGVLTLVSFTMPEDPTKQPYMNNQWGGPHTEPYKGDVVNSYNDGPVAPGKPGLGPFYEIESLSPTLALKTGQSLEHRHRTVHIQAELPTLARLAQEVLGVDLETVRREMLGQ